MLSGLSLSFICASFSSHFHADFLRYGHTPTLQVGALDRGWSVLPVRVPRSGLRSRRSTVTATAMSSCVVRYPRCEGVEPSPTPVIACRSERDGGCVASRERGVVLPPKSRIELEPKGIPLSSRRKHDLQRSGAPCSVASSSIRGPVLACLLDVVEIRGFVRVGRPVRCACSLPLR